MSAFQRLYGQRDQFRGLMFLEPVERNLTIRWISSIIASQSKYGVDDGISGACDDPPDNVDIDPHLRTQHR
jgi:hypothetical protein